MKILLLDCETAPNIAHVWGLRDVNISLNQLQSSSYVMCFAAKWLGKKEVIFDSVRKSGARRMLRRIHRLMNEADAIVHYNGSSFDIPTLNKEFVQYNMLPPSPSRQIDLLLTARSKFRFPSNKLDYVAKALKVGGKLKHAGHELWVQCMAGDGSAWRTMEAYNKRDVTLLEKVYHKLLPWIKGHPDRNLYVDVDDATGKPQCAHCLRDLQRRGFAFTAGAKYIRFQCMGCGAWHRGSYNMAKKRGTRIDGPASTDPTGYALSR